MLLNRHLTVYERKYVKTQTFSCLMFVHFCYLGWENKQDVCAAEVFNTLHTAKREQSFTSSVVRARLLSSPFGKIPRILFRWVLSLGSPEVHLDSNHSSAAFSFSWLHVVRLICKSLNTTVPFDRRPQSTSNLLLFIGWPGPSVRSHYRDEPPAKQQAITHSQWSKLVLRKSSRLLTSRPQLRSLLLNT